MDYWNGSKNHGNKLERYRMSTWHMIHITINASPTKDILKIMLHRGIKNNIVYLSSLTDFCTEITALNRTIDNILDQFKTPWNQKPITVEARCLDAYFDIIFNSYTQSTMSISLSLISNHWIKNKYGNNCIDYQKYIRLLLILCNNFPIISIKTTAF